MPPKYVPSPRKGGEWHAASKHGKAPTLRPILPKGQPVLRPRGPPASEMMPVRGPLQPGKQPMVSASWATPSSKSAPTERGDREPKLLVPKFAQLSKSAAEPVTIAPGTSKAPPLQPQKGEELETREAPIDMLCLLHRAPSTAGPPPSHEGIAALLDAIVGEDAGPSGRVAKAWVAAMSLGPPPESAVPLLRDAFASLSPASELLAAAVAGSTNGEEDGVHKAAAFLAAAKTNTSKDNGISVEHNEGMRKALKAAMATNTDLRDMDGLDEMLASRSPTEVATSLIGKLVPPPQHWQQVPPPAFEEPRTGMEVLKSLAQAQEAAEAEKAKPPVAGYAMASMLHRAAENAKRSARSRLAAGESASGTAPAQSRTRAVGEDAGSEVKSMLYLGNIPAGTGEGLILAECSKYGAISSIFYQADADALLEDRWALVRFDDPDVTSTAVERISRRVGLFGATSHQPLQVRFGELADIDRMQQARAGPSLPSAAALEEQLRRGVEDGAGGAARLPGSILWGEPSATGCAPSAASGPGERRCREARTAAAVTGDEGETKGAGREAALGGGGARAGGTETGAGGRTAGGASSSL